MAILSGKKEMEMIRIYKTCLIILVLVLVNSCSLFKSMPKLDSKVDLINAIMKNPEYAEYYIKNSKFYSKEYSKCVNSEMSIFKYYYLRTLDTIQKYTHFHYYVGIDTVLLSEDFEQNEQKFQRIHVFYDNSLKGIRFDFIKVDSTDYLYEIRYILNKKKIIQESGSKIELFTNILDNPEKYFEIIKNSIFYKNGISIIANAEYIEQIKQTFEDFKNNGEYYFKNVISYSNYTINRIDYEVPFHMILMLNKLDINKSYNLLVFKYIDGQWVITSDVMNGEYVWSVMGGEDDNY